MTLANWRERVWSQELHETVNDRLARGLLWFVCFAIYSVFDDARGCHPPHSFSLLGYSDRSSDVGRGRVVARRRHCTRWYRADPTRRSNIEIKLTQLSVFFLFFFFLSCHKLALITFQIDKLTTNTRSNLIDLSQHSVEQSRRSHRELLRRHAANR